MGSINVHGKSDARTNKSSTLSQLEPWNNLARHHCAIATLWTHSCYTKTTYMWPGTTKQEMYITFSKPSYYYEVIKQTFPNICTLFEVSSTNRTWDINIIC